MLQRLIDEVKEEAKEKNRELNSAETLLIIDDIPFEELNQEDFKSKIISYSNWIGDIYSLSKKYNRENIHIVRLKDLFEKANVERDGYFIYKEELWKHIPYINVLVAKSETGSCCTFTEGHGDEDWIQKEEITPLDEVKISKLIKDNIKLLLK